MKFNLFDSLGNYVGFLEDTDDGSDALAGFMGYIILGIIALATIGVSLFIVWPMLYKMTIVAKQPGFYEYGLLFYVLASVFISYLITLISKSVNHKFLSIYTRSSMIIGELMAIWVLIEGLYTKVDVLELIIITLATIFLAGFMINLLPAFVMVPCTSFIKKKREKIYNHVRNGV